MDPPPFDLILGMHAFEPRNPPLTLTSMTLDQSSEEISSTLPREVTPALFTRISSFPNRLIASSTALSQSDSLVTSRLTKKHSPPDWTISLAVLCPAFSSTSPMMTLAPSPARTLVMAAPIPLAPPLTNATLFSSLICASPFSFIKVVPLRRRSTQIPG